MALEAQGTNSRKKWGWITKDYNDLVGSSTAAIGSADNSDDANIHQVYIHKFTIHLCTYPSLPPFCLLINLHFFSFLFC